MYLVEKSFEDQKEWRQAMQLKEQEYPRLKKVRFFFFATLLDLFLFTQIEWNDRRSIQ